MPKLHVDYARALRPYPDGIALYHPFPAKSLFPGACGYFNGEGKWETIFHLNHIPENKGITNLPAIVEEKPPRNVDWRIKTSTSMNVVRVTARARATVLPGSAPLSGGFDWTYENTGETGAILLTDYPVVERDWPFEAPYDEWCKQNAKQLVQHWPDIKKFGFCIILNTCSTSKWALMTSSTRGELVKVAMNTDVEGAVELGAAVQWHQFTKTGAWKYSPPKSIWPDWLYRYLWPDDELQGDWVVAVNGLWYTHNTVAKVFGMNRLRRRNKPGTLGDSSESEDDETTEQNTVGGGSVEHNLNPDSFGSLLAAWEAKVVREGEQLAKEQRSTQVSA